VRREKLTSDEIKDELNKTNGWNFKDDAISKRFEFKNFAASLAFVNAVGAMAEEVDHHPDITFGWGYAEVALTTHDRGGVTDVDIDLAKQIEELGT
jgi:4a-hydroxytetrahydrobiopterin dehydratase